MEGTMTEVVGRYGLPRTSRHSTAPELADVKVVLGVEGAQTHRLVEVGRRGRPTVSSRSSPCPPRRTLPRSTGGGVEPRSWSVR